LPSSEAPPAPLKAYWYTLYIENPGWPEFPEMLVTLPLVEVVPPAPPTNKAYVLELVAAPAPNP